MEVVVDPLEPLPERLRSLVLAASPADDDLLLELRADGVSFDGIDLAWIDETTRRTISAAIALRTEGRTFKESDPQKAESMKADVIALCELADARIAEGVGRGLEQLEQACRSQVFRSASSLKVSAAIASIYSQALQNHSA